MTITWCMVPEIWSLLPHQWPQNPNFEKMKKNPGDNIILHKSSKNHDHMIYCFWDMAQENLKNQNYKKWKKQLEITSLYTCIPKIVITWCTVPEIWCTTDRWTDGQKKWHIEVGAPPKNHTHVKKVRHTSEFLFDIYW